MTTLPIRGVRAVPVPPMPTPRAPLPATVAYGEDSDDLHSRWAGMDAYPPLPAGEVAALARAAQSGDRAARNRLICHNLRLVISVAKHYVHKTQAFTMHDLIGEGVFGLMDAIDRYEPDTAAFSTFAIWWIRQAISRALARQESLIRTPEYLQTAQRKIRRFTDMHDMAEMDTSDTAPLTDDALREMFNLSEDGLQALRHAPAPPLSLDSVADAQAGRMHKSSAHNADEEADAWANLLRDTDTDTEAEALARIDAAHLYPLMERVLDRREYAIIALRFGIGPLAATLPWGCDGLSLEATGKRMGITRERGRQLQKAALGKLRMALLAERAREAA